MTKEMTNQDQEKARYTQLTHEILSLADRLGATQAEVEIGSGVGLSVTARMGEVEKIEHERDKGLGITVYIDKHKGSANTTDFSNNSIDETVHAACHIARNTSRDDAAGLADAGLMAVDIPDLDLYHPWGISPEQAMEIAIECEQFARDFDPRIKNSDGAVVSTYSGIHVYGNSHGFVNGWNWSSHMIDCTMIAEQSGKMQRDGWYSKSRASGDLLTTEAIGNEAARRTVGRLDARKLSTRQCPVIFEAPVASGLFSAFITAISGGSLYRKASFLLDKLQQQVFSGHINISEQPHLKRALGSAPFDNDGVATRTRDIVKDGVLQGYVLSSYSARKLGMQTTGNAGGVHNLVIQTQDKDLNTLLQEMDRGLLITDMIGFGVNQVTGDYSRGASGFWIENGEIAYPVEEITVAGNLADMYLHIISIGKDIDWRGNILTGSVMIENMTVAGE